MPSETFHLTSDDTLSRLARSEGIHTWADLLSYVRQLPYGRNADRHDLSLVFSERQGTCSSKHALAKTLADLNGVPAVELIMCLYRMTPQNTPGIGKGLAEAGLPHLPEAHCYIKCHDIPVDLTSTTADWQRLSSDILEEHPIRPGQVSVDKVNYHRHYLKKWLSEYYPSHDLDHVWAIRERCIANLSASHSAKREG